VATPEAFQPWPPPRSCDGAVQIAHEGIHDRIATGGIPFGEIRAFIGQGPVPDAR